VNIIKYFYIWNVIESTSGEGKYTGSEVN